MSNQIRPSSPVVLQGEPVVLEILVEPGINAYTWVVAQEQVAATGQVVAHGWRPRTGTRRPPASASVTVATTLAVGDYAVRLFGGRPASPGDLASFLASADLLDEDTFSVTDAGAEASATLAGFRTFIAARWALQDHYDAGSWPALGSTPYRALVDATRDFVGRTTVSSFHDLVPAGYTEGIADGTTLRLPELVAPPADSGEEAFPAVELIWNYWLEEGMLVQTLDAIVAHFQDLRQPGAEPLARFDVTPLRPLRSRLSGHAADEVHRTTVHRRSSEYEHEYGFPLIGRAPSRRDAGAQRRSRFVETFHRVLFLGHRHLRDLDDLTIQADAFALYLALRDGHLVLAEGANHLDGTVAITARAEFMVMQSLLAEPQVRQFLGGRSITPHPEPWMDRVDSMTRIQGWAGTGVVHFYDLATCGERLVLTIRLGDWADPAVGAQEAATWARVFRADIQRYVGAYRAATGVDLTCEEDAEPPPMLLARRRGDGAAGDVRRSARQRARALRAIADELEVEASRDDC